MNMTKPFVIPKELVWKAYKRVKKNKGVAGVDEQSIEEFEVELGKNLYKLWNRLSSGSYFPPAVLTVEIPKDSGGKRRLGIPTVSDRIAQMVVKMILEPLMDPYFHEDSYGYRPGKSALEAVGAARKRCWEFDWVVDLDMKGFFDNLDHERMMKAVRKHTKEKWVILYVERWLKAPAQLSDGTLSPRDKGTPQGGVISPLLANLFLHYALDEWLKRKYPSVRFERYADDVVVHCRTEQEAVEVLEAIRNRLGECCLELNEQKTKIVYCKDSNRRGVWPQKSFDFLGYSFMPRRSKSRKGALFTGFNPAVSGKAAKKMKEQMRKWKIHRCVSITLQDLAKTLNPVLKGWLNYYGRFHRSALYSVFKTLDFALKKWAVRKYKRFRRSYWRAEQWLGRIRRSEPTLFAHWQLGQVSTVGR